MRRSISSMYVYNALDIACCRLFPYYLTQQALAWYSHILWEVFQASMIWEKNVLSVSWFMLFLFTPTSDFLLSIYQSRMSQFVIIRPYSIKQHRKFLVFPKENSFKHIDTVYVIPRFLESWLSKSSQILIPVIQH